MKTIRIYGADWCSDCIVAKNFLTSRKIKFEYIVITENKEAIEFVMKINNGKRIIPTIEIDGETYTNPGIKKLMEIIKQ